MGAKIALLLFGAIFLPGVLAFLASIVAMLAANAWWDHALSQGPEAMGELRRWAFGGSWDIGYSYIIVLGPVFVGALTMLATSAYLICRWFWPPLTERFPPILYFSLLFVVWPIAELIRQRYWHAPFSELVLILPGFSWGLLLQFQLERYLAIDMQADHE